MREEELVQLGEKLQKARESKKIDLKQIADRTKINIKFLKDMEAGKFSFLPELYVRNFLKLYLQQLGEDVSGLLGEYDSITTKEEELNITVVTEDDLKNIKASKQLRSQFLTLIEKIKPYIRQMNFIWLGIGGVIVILVIYSLIKGGSNQKIISAGSTGKTIREVPKNSTDTSSSLFVNKIFNEKELTLELKGLERTWLQISVDDSVAQEHIFDSGMTHTWHAKDKFKLLIGNAAGIRLFLNGKDLGSLGKTGQVIKIDLNEDGIQNFSL